MEKVIVLNADYSFLNMVDWQKAIKLMVKNKVEVVKATTKLITNFEGTFKALIPSIIRLISMVRAVYRNKVPFSKKNIYIRDSFTCQYCGTNTKEPTVDHIIPKSRGGKSVFENCVTACLNCNQRKADKTPKEALMFIKRTPVQPTIMEFMLIRAKLLGDKNNLTELYELQY